MSASRQKKLRQGQTPADLEKKQQAATAEAKAARSLKVWTVVFFVVLAAMVIGVAVSSALSMGVMERTLTAATVGSHKLTAADLNYYYLNAVNNEQYLPYMVDNSLPLTEQEYEEGQTWADVMMDTALQTARNTYAVYDEAVANGYKLTEDQQKSIDSELNAVKMYASMYGFSDGSSFLAANYGKGCTVKSYRNYLTVNAVAAGYRDQVIEGITFTQDQIEAEANANPDKYTSYTYRSVGLYASSYYTDDGENNPERTDEEKAAALNVAYTHAANIVAEGKAGEEAFSAAVVAEQGTDASLKSDYLKSSIAAALSDWVTDPARQAGDVEVLPIDGDAGYYAVMFLSSDDNTETHLVDVRHILIKTSETMDEESALAKAEAIMTEYETDPTEAKFIELANEYTEDTGSTGNGGLYEGVYPGQMVTEFNDWCFDAARKTGDVDIVKTTYGYHLMYFVGTDEQSFRDYMAANSLQSDAYTTWYTGVTEAVAYTQGSGMKYTKMDVTVQMPQSNSSAN